MRVLVACERSGIVRDAFIRRGHTALSCDMEPTDSPGPHHRGDVRPLLQMPWDLLVAHPPCTYLCNIGSQHLHRPDTRLRWLHFDEGVKFFLDCLNSPISRRCIENPVMHGHALELVGPYTQIVHPWQHGNEASKPTCLWLRNLPPLAPSRVVSKGDFVEYRGRRMAKWFDDAWDLSPEECKRVRSETFLGIAEAMAEQWTNL